MLLKELFEFMPKSSRPASYGQKQGTFPFFTSSNTIDKYCDEADYNGEYLIVGDGGTGNCKYYNGKFSVSDHNYVLKPIIGTNCKLLKYFLMKDDYKILNEGFKGIGIKNVSKTYIQNIDFKKNNSYSDEYIVNSLTMIEKIIEKEQLQLEKLNELTKSRFIELFGDVESNTHGYQICKLSEISYYWNGLTYKPTDVVEDKMGTLVLRSSNIQNGELDFQDNVYVNCPIKDRHFVKENDILMCSRNGSAKLVGKVALIKGLNEPTSFGAFMMIIRSKYYQYLKSFFESAAFKHQLSTGTATINQITGNMLNEIKLPIPPMNVVDQFSSFVESVDKLKFSA